MITAEMLRHLAPRARQDYIDALVGGDAEFQKWGINTPNRLASFLAVIMHETGALTIVRENTGWTKANLAIFSKSRAAKIMPFVGDKVKEANAAYGDRMGNERDGTNDDDGWRFRGGGMIQLTGRDSYEQAGKAIGVDLGAHPELIEDAKVSLAAACWEFSQWLTYADKGEIGFRAVCNAINRGNPLSSLPPIGWDERRPWFAKCSACLGGTQAADDSLSVGDSGAMVKAVQERLQALGYASGKVDGVFGSRTRASVLAFQAENGIAISGTVDASTRAALNSEAAKPMPVGERANETAADLRAAGSQITIDAQSIKTAAKTVVAVGVAAGAGDQASPAVAPPAPLGIDPIAASKDIVDSISAWKVIVNGLVDSWHFAFSHWYIFAILAGFAFHYWGGKIEWKRLLDHRAGLNLSK